MLNELPYNQYKQTSIDTASPEKLLIMLYDGAIKFINQAKIFMNEGNIEKTNHALTKTQDIINELMVTLNMDVGDIAHQLYNLYDYFRQRLIEANIKKDVLILDEIANHLVELRSAWAEAATMTKSSKRVVNGLNIEA